MIDVTFGPSTKSKSSNDALKFNLYVKTRQIQEVANVLQSVQGQSSDLRDQWLQEHEETMNTMLDSFMDEASGVFDGLYLDREAMDLSMQFVQTVREVMGKLQSLVGNRPMQPPEEGPLDF